MTLNFKKRYEKKELPSFVECWRGFSKHVTTAIISSYVLIFGLVIVI